MKNKSVAEERELAVAIGTVGIGERLTGNQHKMAFWNKEDILKADSGDRYTALWANQTLRTAKMVNFMPSIFHAGKNEATFLGVGILVEHEDTTDELFRFAHRLCRSLARGKFSKHFKLRCLSSAKNL